MLTLSAALAVTLPSTSTWTGMSTVCWGATDDADTTSETVPEACGFSAVGPLGPETVSHTGRVHARPAMDPLLDLAPAGITGQFTGPAAQELIGSFFFGYVSPVSGQDFSAAGAFIAQR